MAFFLDGTTHHDIRTRTEDQAKNSQGRMSRRAHMLVTQRNKRGRPDAVKGEVPPRKVVRAPRR